MAAKVTKVVLECPPLNTTQEFEISHAERLLRIKNNGGWQLPEKSTFEFVDNGIRVSCLLIRSTQWVFFELSDN